MSSQKLEELAEAPASVRYDFSGVGGGGGSDLMSMSSSPISGSKSGVTSWWVAYGKDKKPAEPPSKGLTFMYSKMPLFLLSASVVVIIILAVLPHAARIAKSKIRK
jgi:hypothetical protein